MTEVDLVSELLEKRLGLVRRLAWARELVVALQTVCATHDLSPVELAARAAWDEPVLLEIAGYVSVGETHFYRCPEHFGRIAEHVASRLAGGASRVRVWSAGCASGEEAYSVAIAIAARLGRAALRLVDVTGTDLNASAIAAARRAQYRPWSFRGAPPWLAARFMRDNSGFCTPIQDVRASVDFQWNSIQSQLFTSPDACFDVVLFRNVAIYLAHETTQEIFRAISRVLKPDGLLIVAATDPQPSPTSFEPVDGEMQTVFRPAHAGRAEAPALPVRKPSPPRVRQAAEAPPVRAAGVGDAALRRAALAADRGDRMGALALLAPLLEETEPAHDALLLRAKIRLAAGELGEALADLRRSVLLDGAKPITRFWYASALLQSGGVEAAVRQLAELERLLATRPQDALLEDGDTTAAELRSAGRFLGESMR